LSQHRKIDVPSPLTDASVQSWATIKGLKVFFERRGRGPTLALVHGLLGYSFSWRFVMPALAAVRDVVALDMPGAGFSDCSVGLDCRLKSAAQRLLSFLDALGVSSCDLVGSSYGGATAMMAAAMVPSRIRSLVLVSPANPWSSIGRKRIAALNLPLMSSIFAPTARAFAPLNAFSIARMFGDPRRMPPDTIRGYTAAMARHGVIEHAVKIVKNWKADMRELEAILPKIADIPTLLLWGDKDRVVDPRSAKLLARQFHRSTIAIIPGAGHLPYEECPEQFSSIVLSFIAEQSQVPVRK
jgi:pimeloyl-ACP methyl ester carboxylesterase